jgi:hypothetical protein
MRVKHIVEKIYHKSGLRKIKAYSLRRYGSTGEYGVLELHDKVLSDVRRSIAILGTSFDLEVDPQRIVSHNIEIILGGSIEVLGSGAIGGR